MIQTYSGFSLLRVFIVVVLFLVFYEMWDSCVDSDCRKKKKKNQPSELVGFLLRLSGGFNGRNDWNNTGD